jgi:hypothetical protein
MRLHPQGKKTPGNVEIIQKKNEKRQVKRVAGGDGILIAATTAGGDAQTCFLVTAV